MAACYFLLSQLYIPRLRYGVEISLYKLPPDISLAQRTDKVPLLPAHGAHGYPTEIPITRVKLRLFYHSYNISK